MADESEAVKKKSLAQQRPQARIALGLDDSLDDRARNAFWYHYVTNDLRTYSYLQTFYAPVSPQQHLSASVDAVSLAFFAHWTNSTSVLARANQRYVSALRHVQEAIQDSNALCQDATLLSAILLDLFEKMTKKNAMSEGAWISHVHGAFSLVRCRGRDQFQRPIGISMLQRLTTSFVISCVVSHRPVPPELVALRADLANYIDCRNPKWRLMDIVVPFVDMQHKSADPIISNREVVNLAHRLDEELIALVDDMPPSWRPEIVHVDRTSERVFEGNYEVFANRHVTQTWNVIRLIRLFIGDIIRKQYEEMGKDYKKTATDKERIRNQLTTEICGSVPQYTIPIEGSGIRSYRPAMMQPLAEVDDNPSPSTCYTLVFPLYVAAHFAPRDSSMKKWILSQLRFIGSVIPVRSVTEVLRILNEDTTTDPWSVYAILGGYGFAA